MHKNISATPAHARSRQHLVISICAPLTRSDPSTRSLESRRKTIRTSTMAIVERRKGLTMIPEPLVRVRINVNLNNQRDETPIGVSFKAIGTVDTDSALRAKACGRGEGIRRLAFGSACRYVAHTDGFYSPVMSNGIQTVSVLRLCLGRLPSPLGGGERFGRVPMPILTLISSPREGASEIRSSRRSREHTDRR